MSNRTRATRSIEPVVSLILQIGVLLSTLVILIGLISFFMHGTPHSTSYHRYTAPAYSFPHNFSSIRNSIRSGQGGGLIELGVLLLICTPVIRVLASIILFSHVRDRPMTIVTCFVFIVLIGSFFLGVAIQ